MLKTLTGYVALAATCAYGQSPQTVTNFSGKFSWIDIHDVPPATVRLLASASSISFDIMFRQDVKLLKDKGGNQWLTFLLADQGVDWKWTQTKSSLSLPVAGGMIKAGKYAVTLPLAGIPKSVLKQKTQTFHLGPGSSGLAKPISFTISNWRAG